MASLVELCACNQQVLGLNLINFNGGGWKFTQMPSDNNNNNYVMVSCQGVYGIEVLSLSAKKIALFLQLFCFFFVSIYVLSSVNQLTN